MQPLVIRAQGGDVDAFALVVRQASLVYPGVVRGRVVPVWPIQVDVVHPLIGISQRTGHCAAAFADIEPRMPCELPEIA